MSSQSQLLGSQYNRSHQYSVRISHHLTLASLHINFCHAYVEPFCHDTRIKCRGISTRNWPRLAWENSQHFATPPLVSPRNDVWETRAEIPYWWRVTTEIWGRFWLVEANFSRGRTNQKHYADLGRHTSSVWNFSVRSADVTSRGNILGNYE